MKIKTLAALAALAVAVPAASWAGAVKPFDQQAFDYAKSEGKLVALDFHAAWCPTCKKLAPNLEKVLKRKEFSQAVVFSVDYDNAKDLEQSLGVRKQSTVVVFKGDKEMARATGLSSPESLSELLRRGL